MDVQTYAIRQELSLPALSVFTDIFPLNIIITPFDWDPLLEEETTMYVLFILHPVDITLFQMWFLSQYYISIYAVHQFLTFNPLDIDVQTPDIQTQNSQFNHYQRSLW